MRKDILDSCLNVRVTSDLHLFHKKAVEFRNFRSIDDMNSTIINRWNAGANDDTLTYVLGDVSFGPPEETEKILRALRGRKRLVIGNHDDNNPRLMDVYKRQFEIQVDILRVKFKDIDEEAILCHYPFLVWNKSHYGSWCLHGHSHGSCKYPNPDVKILDVGVDCHEYMPISISEVHEIMSTRTKPKFDNH